MAKSDRNITNEIRNLQERNTHVKEAVIQVGRVVEKKRALIPEVDPNSELTEKYAKSALLWEKLLRVETMQRKNIDKPCFERLSQLDAIEQQNEVLHRKIETISDCLETILKESLTTVIDIKQQSSSQLLSMIDQIDSSLKSNHEGVLSNMVDIASYLDRRSDSDFYGMLEIDQTVSSRSKASSKVDSEADTTIKNASKSPGSDALGNKGKGNGPINVKGKDRDGPIRSNLPKKPEMVNFEAEFNPMRNHTAEDKARFDRELVASKGQLESEKPKPLTRLRAADRYINKPSPVTGKRR